MVDIIGLLPVSALDACRIHGGPRPCAACRLAKSPKRKRFLGTPRKGWKPVLPADQQSALPVDWKGDSRPWNRRKVKDRQWGRQYAGPKA